MLHVTFKVSVSQKSILDLKFQKYSRFTISYQYFLESYFNSRNEVKILG